MGIDVQIVDAFIDGTFGGNPAGVVLDSEALETSQKQAIAAELGLSETVFVEATGTGFKCDFFTPNRQIPDCGHATVAAFSYLRELGRIRGERSAKETIEGVRDIYLEDDLIFMQQRAPAWKAVTDRLSRIRASLNLEEEAWSHTPMIVNTGVNFLLIPLANAEAVRAVQPNQQLIEALSEELDLVGYYVFSQEAETGQDAGTRMFAPRYAIDEESATGMAAGPLACYLYTHLGVKKSTIYIEQGRLMDPASPSLLTAKLMIEEGQIKELQVGGRGRVRETRHMEIPKRDVLSGASS